MGADLSKPICLDQPFSGNNPENSFKFYNNPYAIIVDNDPRDLYLAANIPKILILNLFQLMMLISILFITEI